MLNFPITQLSFEDSRVEVGRHLRVHRRLKVEIVPRGIELNGRIMVDLTWHLIIARVTFHSVFPILVPGDVQSNYRDVSPQNDNPCRTVEDRLVEYPYNIQYVSRPRYTLLCPPSRCIFPFVPYSIYMQH